MFFVNWHWLICYKTITFSIYIKLETVLSYPHIAKKIYIWLLLRSQKPHTKSSQSHCTFPIAAYRNILDLCLYIYKTTSLFSPFSWNFNKPKIILNHFQLYNPIIFIIFIYLIWYIFLAFTNYLICISKRNKVLIN